MSPAASHDGRRALTAFTIAMVLSLAATSGCASGSADHDSGPAADWVPDQPQTALEDRLQAAVDEFLSSRLVPGASVAVIRDGELVEVVSGMADIDGGRPVTASTQFRVASITKMYIAAVVLRLVERGELSLDDPIGPQGLVLPEDLAFVWDLTLRQLLSHTSGVGQSFVRDEDRGQPVSHADLVERMPQPTCAPSTCWVYGDVNYVLAEVVLEAHTGRSLADLISDELGEQFDLSDTSVVNAALTDVAMPPQYALVSDESGHPVEPRRLFQQAFPLAPTLITTAPDAARFANALFTGEGLDPSSLAEMLDTSAMRDLPCPAECRFEYGLGVFHYNLAGHEPVGHDGSSGSIVVHDRSRDLTVAILTNGGEQDIGAFVETVIDAIDEADG